MATVGTTAVQLWQGTGRPASFVIEADPGNSGVVRISSTDPHVVANFITLSAGQQQPFNGFSRSIWAVGSAAGQLVYVDLVDDVGAETASKGP